MKGVWKNRDYNPALENHIAQKNAHIEDINLNIISPLLKQKGEKSHVADILDLLDYTPIPDNEHYHDLHNIIYGRMAFEALLELDKFVKEDYETIVNMATDVSEIDQIFIWSQRNPGMARKRLKDFLKCIARYILRKKQSLPSPDKYAPDWIDEPSEELARTLDEIVSFCDDYFPPDRPKQIKGQRVDHPCIANRDLVFETVTRRVVGDALFNYLRQHNLNRNIAIDSLDKNSEMLGPFFEGKPTTTKKQRSRTGYNQIAKKLDFHKPHTDNIYRDALLWVRIRILEEWETQAQMASDLCMYETDLSNILQPFDEAFLFERKPGPRQETIDIYED